MARIPRYQRSQQASASVKYARVDPRVMSKPWDDLAKTGQKISNEVGGFLERRRLVAEKEAEQNNSVLQTEYEKSFDLQKETINNFTAKQDEQGLEVTEDQLLKINQEFATKRADIVGQMSGTVADKYQVDYDVKEQELSLATNTLVTTRRIKQRNETFKANVDTLLGAGNFAGADEAIEGASWLTNKEMSEYKVQRDEAFTKYETQRLSQDIRINVELRRIDDAKALQSELSGLNKIEAERQRGFIERSEIGFKRDDEIIRLGDFIKDGNDAGLTKSVDALKELGVSEERITNETSSFYQAKYNVNIFESDATSLKAIDEQIEDDKGWLTPSAYGDLKKRVTFRQKALKQEALSLTTGLLKEVKAGNDISQTIDENAEYLSDTVGAEYVDMLRNENTLGQLGFEDAEAQAKARAKEAGVAFKERFWTKDKVGMAEGVMMSGLPAADKIVLLENMDIIGSPDVKYEAVGSFASGWKVTNNHDAKKKLVQIVKNASRQTGNAKHFETLISSLKAVEDMSDEQAVEYLDEQAKGVANKANLDISFGVWVGASPVGAQASAQVREEQRVDSILREVREEMDGSSESEIKAEVIRRINQ